MLEEIRRRVMVSNSKKSAEALRAKGEYTPRAVALLDQQIDLAKNCRSLPCGLGKYEVSCFTERYVVHLRNETSCTCRLYLISGIPCCHIASALRLEKDVDQDPKTLISPWFTVEKWRQCYANALKPVNGMNLWKETTDVRVIPPPYKRPPGRPPGKKRRKEKGEANPKPGKQLKRGIKMHCGNCGQEGHNKSKCTNAPVPKPPKKPPGRPKSRATTSDASAWLTTTEGGSSNTVQGGSSSQPAQSVAWRPWSDVISASNSQPVKDIPSLSSALPRKRRGRPRKTPTSV